MKKAEFAKKIKTQQFLAAGALVPRPVTAAKMEKTREAIRVFEARIGGRKGAEDARDRFFEAYCRVFPRRVRDTSPRSREGRLAAWKARSARELALCAAIIPDEHGGGYGDYLSVRGIDFVPPHLSAAGPYHDMGGKGLGLVDVTRRRVYPKSSGWGPSSVSTMFLVGRNEAGTYFSHPVSAGCETVGQALAWIWSGQEGQILQRQGDIALIQSNGGPRMPAALPAGHRDGGDGYIHHETHPPLPLPQKGQRVIVGRRAADRATSATRD